jgi:hypothetical protein
VPNEEQAEVSGRKMENNLEFAGRVALITGGNRGIGAAAASRLAELGADSRIGPSFVPQPIAEVNGGRKRLRTVAMPFALYSAMFVVIVAVCKMPLGIASAAVMARMVSIASTVTLFEIVVQILGISKGWSRMHCNAPALLSAMSQAVADHLSCSLMS